jgi:hypothetical protein
MWLRWLLAAMLMASVAIAQNEKSCGIDSRSCSAEVRFRFKFVLRSPVIDACARRKCNLCREHSNQETKFDAFVELALRAWF